MDDFLTADKLWRLLEIALADLTIIEQTPGYAVDMRYYIRQDNVCHVCLAGACLIQHGLVSSFMDIAPDYNVRRRCEAIDWLRQGRVGIASRCFGSNEPLDKDRVVTGYYDCRELWLRDMKALLEELKACNI